MAASEKETEVGTVSFSPTTSHLATRSQPPVKDNAWIRFMTYLRFYARESSSEEKSLLLRLDLSILIFGCLSFFTNGMREDLGLHRKDINYMTATFWASYCTFMIPACYFLTHYPANIILPVLEVGWGLSSFGLAWAPNVQTVYAMRFFTGLFECCSFTGTIYVTGSWYKPHEIGRRVALFFIASPLGTMFAGYLQAAAYKNLNGVHGLAGWRWLFIVDAILTLPISVVGFFVFPDVPSRKKPRVLNAANHTFAKQRLQGITAPPQLRLSRSIFRRVFFQWHWYLSVAQWSILDQNFLLSGQPFSLYLKAKSELYSVVRINTLPTIATATGRFWIPNYVVTLPVLVGTAVLVAWEVGESGRRAGFILTGFEGAISPLTMGWATVTMASDAEERAVVTASMNAIGQGIMAGLQVLQYPATSAPNFRGGFISNLATSVVQLILISAILWLSARDKRKASNRDSKSQDVEFNRLSVVVADK